MLEHDIEEVEIDIEHARKAIKKMEALDRLYKSKDFQDVVVEGYFKEEASRLVLLKGDLNIPDESIAHCDKMINGIGCLRGYFQMVNHFGDQAKQAMDDFEATKEELLQEQLEDDR
jgi:tRNA A58 N-methylase Trm61